MRARNVILTVAWAISLMVVAALARVQTPAQRAPFGTVLSGGDIGFRLERMGPNSAIGEFVVRINGEWIPAERVERFRRVK